MIRHRKSPFGGTIFEEKYRGIQSNDHTESLFFFVSKPNILHSSSHANCGESVPNSSNHPDLASSL